MRTFTSKEVREHAYSTGQSMMAAKAELMAPYVRQEHDRLMFAVQNAEKFEDLKEALIYVLARTRPS